MRENNLQFHDISKPVCKIFPDDWITSIGSECFSLYSGVTPLHLRDDDRGEFLYLKVDDFNEPRNSQGLAYSFITFDKERNFNIETFNPGVIIFPKRGAAIFQNRVQVLKKEATVDPNLMVLKPKFGVHAQYFRYHLINFGLFNICDNSGIPQINNCHLYPLRFTYPQLREQQKIAEIIDTIDKVIALTDTHVTKLKKAKAGLLHDLLTRGIDDHGELRDYTRNPELFKRSLLGIIPKDWETPTIDEVTVDDSPICYGIVQTGSYVESGVPVLAIYNMGRDYITNIHRASQLIENRYIRSRVKPNDVLISVKGTIGRVDIVPNHFFGNISRDIARIRLKSYVLPKYVFQTLSSQILQLQIIRTAVGTTRAEISIWILKQLRLPLPPIEEQERIVNYLDTHNFRIRSQETRLEKLKLLKKGLMSDLLTGRVRVKI